MEPSLIEMFQFVVRKDMHLTWPRGETPTHYIVMGMDEELVVATKIALLISVLPSWWSAKKGVHGMILKSIFPPGTAPR
jgi:hypothetical protein